MTRLQRWGVHLRAIAAGLLCSTLVAGLIALSVRLELLNDSPAVRWVMVGLGSFVGVLVMASFQSNRGIDP